MLILTLTFCLLVQGSPTTSPTLIGATVKDQEWVPRAMRGAEDPETNHPDPTPGGNSKNNLPGDQGQLKINQGIVFKNLGEIIVSGNYWTLVIEAKLNIYHTNMKTLEESVLVYKNRLEALSFANRNMDVSVVKEVFERIIQSHFEEVKEFFRHYNVTEAALNELEVALGAAPIDRMSFGNIRGKRNTLLGGIGDAMNYLFGTATDSQIKELATHMDSLNTANSKVFQILERQATLLKTEITNTEQQAQAIQEIEDKNIEIGKVIEDLTSALQEVQNTSELIPFLAHALDVLNFLEIQENNYRLMMSKIIQNINNLEEALQSTAAGKLSHHFVNKEELLLALREIEKDLPPTLTLAIPNDLEHLYLYYNHVEVVTTGHGGKVRIFAHIPLKSVNRQFTLHQAIPWPTPTEEGSETVFMVDLINTHIAVSLDKQSFFELTDQEAKECISGIKICAPASPVYSTPHTSCLYSLITQIKLPNTCNHRVAVVTLPQFALVGEPNIWLYYTHEPIRFSITCMPFNPDDRVEVAEIILSGAGIYHLASNCSAKSKGITLPTNYRASSMIRISHVNRIDVPNVPELKDLIPIPNLNTLKDLPSLENKVVTSRLKPIKHIGMEVSELQREIKRAKEQSEKDWRVRLISHSQVAQWGVWILLIAGTLVLFCGSYLKKKVSAIGNRFRRRRADITEEGEAISLGSFHQVPTAPPKAMERGKNQ